MMQGIPAVLPLHGMRRFSAARITAAVKIRQGVTFLDTRHQFMGGFDAGEWRVARALCSHGYVFGRPLVGAAAAVAAAAEALVCPLLEGVPGQHLRHHPLSACHTRLQISQDLTMHCAFMDDGSSSVNLLLARSPLGCSFHYYFKLRTMARPSVKRPRSHSPQSHFLQHLVPHTYPPRLLQVANKTVQAGRL